MTRSASAAAYPTISTVGALLPPDMLARVATGDLADSKPSDYGLPDGFTLRQAASRAWELLLPTYRSFRQRVEALPPGDPATTITRDRWTSVLLRELGYDLKDLPGIVIDDDVFDIRHVDGHVPIHLLGWNVELDRRAQTNIRGASRTAPHSLVQEMLNRTDDHLWALLGNGRRLRLLRDNIAMGRPAYVEFDLEGMFEGEQFADFALMYALIHATRFRSATPAGCRMEVWRGSAIAEGTRALQDLRVGVRNAVETLGRGFLEHPDNSGLRDLLAAGGGALDEYYRWLLRLVYRLIFLMVAEDRDVLHGSDVGTAARHWYRDYFSVGRLRTLAQRRRAGRHSDLWISQQLVFKALGQGGLPAMGLPAYGSFLFEEGSTGALSASQLSNRRLLEAVGYLSLLIDKQSGAQRPVDYKNLGAEELGSVYESLLEYVPTAGEAHDTFTLELLGGNSRKTSGSYYTPTELVDVVLDEALEPLLAQAARQPDPVEALLAVTVCDPACGSGHFLVGAARRIARRLAIAESGDPEPSVEATRTAMRRVVARCIYGVDLNDLAAELAKISLWLEALTPGKPLTFLDSHIKVGNALLGATPARLAGNIPDDAFEALHGDDKAYATALKKRNKNEHAAMEARQDSLFSVHGIRVTNDVFRSAATSVEEASDDDIVSLRQKADAWRQADQDPELARARLVADAWCAAFVWPISRGEVTPPTHDTLVALQADPDMLPLQPQRLALEALARRYRFFHWHLEFPQIFRVGEGLPGDQGWSGGFSCVLGNPPWDTLSPDAKEFFSTFDPAVRQAAKQEQDAIRETLLEVPAISDAWDRYQRDLYCTAHFLKRSGNYTMYAPGSLGKGDFNVYRSFVERALRLTAPDGAVSQLVPSGLYQGANAAAIREALLSRYPLKLLLGFVNLKKTWFPDIHSETKFCLYAANAGGQPAPFAAGFRLITLADLKSALDERTLIAPELITEMSPGELAISEGLVGPAARLTSQLFGRHPKFGDPGRPDKRFYQREFDMGNDRTVFGNDPDGLPLFEGRMVAAFDYRAKRWVSGRGRSAVWADLPFGQPKDIHPQWRVQEELIPARIKSRVRDYRLGFCDVTSPQTALPLSATLLPPDTVSGDKVPTITFDPEYRWA